MRLDHSLHEGVGPESSGSHGSGSDSSDCPSASAIGGLSGLLLDYDGPLLLLELHLDLHLDFLLWWRVVAIGYGLVRTAARLFLGAFEVDEFVGALGEMSTESGGNSEGAIAAKTLVDGVAGLSDWVVLDVPSVLGVEFETE